MPKVKIYYDVAKQNVKKIPKKVLISREFAFSLVNVALG